MKVKEMFEKVLYWYCESASHVYNHR